MDSRVVVPMTAGMLERLTEAANRNQCTLAEATRQALAAWLDAGGHERQVEYRHFRDTSVDEMLGGPPAISASAPKAERLAHARALVASGAETEQRGYETRTVGPSKLELKMRVPGESRVEYDREAVQGSKRAGDDTGRG